MDAAARSLTRRTFLSGSAAVLAATACGRDGRTPAAPTPAELVFNQAHVELARGDRRLAFALTRGGTPLRYVDGAGGTLDARNLETGLEHTGVAVRSFPIVRSTGGDDAAGRRGSGDLIFAAIVPFDDPGFWTIDARLRVGGETLRVDGKVGVAERSQTVAVGEPAVSTPTPTTADNRGVDPICTRKPPCTMHMISLDAALGNGKPTIATFATPALCTSRMCGPDVDVVEAVHLRRPDDANYIHVEIYADAGGATVAPAVAVWKVDEAGEPWVFGIGRDGVVRERLSGPIGEWEVDELVDRLIA